MRNLVGRQTYAGFVEDCKEGVLVYATGNPTGKVLYVLLEFYVAAAISSVWMDYRKVFRLVVAWRRGGDTFGHGGERQSRHAADVLVLWLALFELGRGSMASRRIDIYPNSKITDV